MAPLMPSEDPNSPKTRLLTLLNVSASRSNKKRRLDALLAPEDGPRKKLNARKVAVVEEEEDQGEGSGSGSDESDEEVEEGAGVEVAATDSAKVKVHTKEQDMRERGDGGRYIRGHAAPR